MEQRQHVVIHLPNDHPLEAHAFNSILTYLRTQAFPRQGFSLVKRIEGYWLSPADEEWVRDYSTLFVTDTLSPRTAAEARTNAELLADIRLFALTAYRAAGRAQEEIWITTHTIERHG